MARDNRIRTKNYADASKKDRDELARLLRARGKPDRGLGKEDLIDALLDDGWTSP